MPAAKAYAYNRSRQAYLATDLVVAQTHWSRFRGLIGTPATNFAAGKGLWIVPCRGVHTAAMRFPIDVLYLDRSKVVVHIETNLAPWRLAAVRWSAQTVLELPQNTVTETGTSLGDHIEIVIAENRVPA